MKIIIHWDNGQTHEFRNCDEAYVKKAEEWLKNKTIITPEVLSNGSTLQINVEKIRMLEFKE